MFGSMRSMTRLTCATIAFVALLGPPTVRAYGPAGHRIAGLAAAPLLCESATREIADLAPGEPFEELGLWADRIRGSDAWRHSAPWHYMNVADGESLREYRHPPEGDILTAIERFGRQLADETLAREVRYDALKFLVHFIVDLHQPLHVGRAEDRGGNEILLRYAGNTVNLHRFWDTDTIAIAGLSDAAYARELSQEARRVAQIDTESAMWAWAEESLALRDSVYGFDDGVADSAYLARAAELTRERLTLAAARLANTLNMILCD
jgi:hypothetical protein